MLSWDDYNEDDNSLAMLKTAALKKEVTAPALPVSEPKKIINTPSNNLYVTSSDAALQLASKEFGAAQSIAKSDDYKDTQNTAQQKAPDVQ